MNTIISSASPARLPQMIQVKSPELLVQQFKTKSRLILQTIDFNLQKRIKRQARQQSGRL